MPKLKRFGVTPELFGDVTLCEQIDGHAIGIHIEALKANPDGEVGVKPGDVLFYGAGGNANFYRVWVQNRQRIVTPDQHDVHGVASWARAHAAQLAETLGPGIHFGEWWGYKICRGYGLGPGDRRFSLYNTARWGFIDGTQVPSLYTQPVLWEGNFLEGWATIRNEMDGLLNHGSVASPGYRHPAGVVLYHHSADVMMQHTFKTEGRYHRRHG
jgi:hypothetical protein